MKLKHAVRFIAGGTPDTANAAFWADDGSGVPWVAIGDMSAGRTVTTTAKSLTAAGVADRRLAIGEPGTVLFAMYASVAAVATLGISAVWNQALLGIVPQKGVADSRFVAYWLRHYARQAVVQANSATQANLNAAQVANFPFASASVESQTRIADFLDDRVARIDRIVAARRDQLMAGVVLGRRRIVDELLGDGFTQLGVKPWFSCGSGARATKLAGPWTVIDCKHRTPDYLSSGYPVISPGDVTAGRLDPTVATRFVGEEDFRDLADDVRRCRRGDLVYSRNASAGTAAFVETDLPFTMGQDVCRITSDSEDQLYLAYCLNYLAEPQLEAARIGSTFTRINVEQIKSLAIPYYDVDDQALVAAECDRVEDEMSSVHSGLTRSIDLLTEYKASLITAAVTGELDVTTAGSGVPA